MKRDLFDRRLRALRRDRAARSGPELFLYDRAFDECMDRLGDISRNYDRALLVGCPAPQWVERLQRLASTVVVCDPGGLFASQSDGDQIEEDRHDFGEQIFDLCLAIGTLDTVNDLGRALQALSRSLKADSPIVGAMAGGHSLPLLRASLMSAGRSIDRVVARTHPRIEASSLAQLLLAAGFAAPVVDVDRVKLSYADLHTLVRDLRGMGATSVLAERSPPFSKLEIDRAAKEFKRLGRDGRTEEVVEIVHFHAWRE